MIEIKRSAQSRIGRKCWSVAATIPDLRARTLADRLTKGDAVALEMRLKRLLNIRAANRNNGRVSMSRSRSAAGHGQWRVV